MELNASDTKIKNFARTSPLGGADFKIIFLDEAGSGKTGKKIVKIEDIPQNKYISMLLVKIHIISLPINFIALTLSGPSGDPGII